MRRAAWMTSLLLLGAFSAAAGGPADPAGIRWERDLTEGLARAAQEGRPVLLCVNALENEGANIHLATMLYPSAPWGEATRGFLCFVGNPNRHGEVTGPCVRYGSAPCASHQETLDYVVRRFGPELISPQHLILEPDGAVAWRKEYFSGDVTPDLLLGWFVRVSPRAAIHRAALSRTTELGPLEQGPLADVPDRAKAWLASGDLLAAAGIASAADVAEDPARRRALVAALASASTDAAPVLREAADPYFVSPRDDPELTAAWLETLAAAIPLQASPDLARLAVRAGDGALRGRALEILDERAPDLAHETRLLLGERIASPPGFDGATTRARRAQKRAGLVDRVWPPIREALDAGEPGPLRGALLEAKAPEVKAVRERVVALVTKAREERVRLAAVLALLGARVDPGAEATEVLLAALTDPVEGVETRSEAVERLGTDPGYDPEMWRQAIRVFTGSGR